MIAGGKHIKEAPARRRGVAAPGLIGRGSAPSRGDGRAQRSFPERQFDACPGGIKPPP